MRTFRFIIGTWSLALLQKSTAFTTCQTSVIRRNLATFPSSTISQQYRQPSSSSLQASVQDLDVVALVAGQQTYGLALVSAGEAVYSFLQFPSFSSVKFLAPGIIAAGVLAGVAGPMVTSGDVGSVSTGLAIATAVSVALGASYVLRLAAAFSEIPKEIAALGLLVAVAGFFCFSQNLVVDGFISLPSLPSISLPSIPSIPEIDVKLPYSE